MSANDFVGEWVALGSSVVFTVSLHKGGIKVEGTDTDDGTHLDIKNPSCDGRVLAFRSVMPSGWAINHELELTNPNTLNGDYSGNASGHETLKRKGHVYSPD